MKVKLIFNPAAGNPAESAAQLMESLRLLQAQKFSAEVILVEPELQLSAIAHRAAREGAPLMVVSGGDGTIENVALGLVGSRTALGIIPTGSRNNLARSLGIPTDDLAGAVALLRNGRPLRIDVGHVRHRETNRYFLEGGAVGLAAALYPAADDIQHGDLGRITEFISTLVSATPSEIRLRLDRRQTVIAERAHLVLVANMPYMGANFQIAPDISFDDCFLDIFVYSGLTKRELIGRALQPPAAEPDTRVQRFRAKTVEIATDPAMPVMADGVPIGDGSVTVSVKPRSLRVMAGGAALSGATP